MNTVDCLLRYKKDLLMILPSNNRFVLDNFTRWYINAKKRSDGIGLLHDPVVSEDIEFANRNHSANININEFMAAASMVFSRYESYSKRTIDEYPKPDLSSISEFQLQHLKSVYLGENFDKDVSKLIELYKLMGMNNIHLSIPPIFRGVELFGSPLNTHNPEYCSPFAFEKIFGSSGSFWNYKFTKSGLYLCNPPFDESLIEKMANRLIKVLGVSRCKLTIFVTVPVWDSETQKELKIRDYGMDFRGYSIMKESAFMKENIVLDRYKYPYFDYYKADSGNNKTPASWTHALILANHDNAPKMFFFTNKWSQF